MSHGATQLADMAQQSGIPRHGTTRLRLPKHKADTNRCQVHSDLFQQNFWKGYLMAEHPTQAEYKRHPAPKQWEKLLCSPSLPLTMEPALQMWQLSIPRLEIGLCPFCQCSCQPLRGHCEKLFPIFRHKTGSSAKWRHFRSLGDKYSPLHQQPGSWWFLPHNQIWINLTEGYKEEKNPPKITCILQLLGNTAWSHEPGPGSEWLAPFTVSKSNTLLLYFTISKDYREHTIVSITLSGCDGFHLHYHCIQIPVLREILTSYPRSWTAFCSSYTLFFIHYAFYCILGTKRHKVTAWHHWAWHSLAPNTLFRELSMQADGKHHFSNFCPAERFFQRTSEDTFIG